MAILYWILIAISVVVLAVMGWRRFAEHIHDKDTDLWTRPTFCGRETDEE